MICIRTKPYRKSRWKQVIVIPDCNDAHLHKNNSPFIQNDHSHNGIGCKMGNFILNQVFPEDINQTENEGICSHVYKRTV